CLSSLVSVSIPFFFLYLSRYHRLLHSFPTRRSSDLPARRPRRHQHRRRLHPARHRLRDRGPQGLRSEPHRRHPPQHLRRRPEQRSEEHTSELQSRENLVCRLLLEKKKKQTNYTKTMT